MAGNIKGFMDRPYHLGHIEALECVAEAFFYGTARLQPTYGMKTNVFSYGFFRQAQFAGMKFEIVPALTGLKFLWDEQNHQDVGPQPFYVERLKVEPNYANNELAAMLITAEHNLHQLPSIRRVMYVEYSYTKTYVKVET